MFKKNVLNATLIVFLDLCGLYTEQHRLTVLGTVGDSHLRSMELGFLFFKYRSHVKSASNTTHKTQFFSLTIR